MPAKEAQEVREALKALGYGRKEVSVRSRRVTYSSAIEVTVKALGVNIKKVREVAERAQSVRRCEVSGEVLMGGNIYVSVSYAYDLGPAFEELAKDLDFSSRNDVQVTDRVLACWEANCWKFWKFHGKCGSYMMTATDATVRETAGRLINEARS